MALKRAASCLVDAQTGELRYRTNEVTTCGHGEGEAGDGEAGADVTMTALAYPGSPLVPPVVQNLAEIDVTVGSSLFQTDVNGFLASCVGFVKNGFHVELLCPC